MTLPHFVQRLMCWLLEDPVEKKDVELKLPEYDPAWLDDRVEFHVTSSRGGGTLWRWRRVAKNRRIVGASTESYKNLSDAEANAVRCNKDLADSVRTHFEGSDPRWSALPA